MRINIERVIDQIQNICQLQANIKKRMIQERKKIKSYNEMLAAYEESCAKLTERCSSEMAQITSDSIKVLCSMFQSYLQDKKIEKQMCQSTQMHSTQQSSAIKQKKSKEQYFEQIDYYPMTSQKKSKKKKEKQSENLQLSKKISKLSLDHKNLLCMDEFNDSSESEDSVTQKLQNYQQKDLKQILIESQKKIKQKVEKENVQPIQQLSQSQYQITDYSSNQSSNDGSYSVHLAEETQKMPLFGGMFTKGSSFQNLNNSNSYNSSTNLLNFSFSSKELLKSPKKLPKSQRLFVGDKKIATWAEDLLEIEKKCQKQGSEAKNIFGKCVVENLNTNILFESKKELIKRTSSAQWKRHIFLT